MISFTLRCAGGHNFDAWFKDGATYDEQVEAGAVSCPVCGDSQISKAPMAPRIGRGHKGPSPEKLAEIRRELLALRKQVEENGVYVGPRFAEEAQKIHFGEAEHKEIYGEATDEEAEELRELGVPFARIPWIPREN